MKTSKTEENVNNVLEHIRKVSGEAELPVRTAFELSQALKCFFGKLEGSPK